MFDEVAEEGGEGFEDLEDQANPGKQPFDHDTPFCSSEPFYVRMHDDKEWRW